MGIEQETHKHLQRQEDKQIKLESMAENLSEFYDWWDEQLENKNDDFYSDFADIVLAVEEDYCLHNIMALECEGKPLDPMPIIKSWLVNVTLRRIVCVCNAWDAEVQRRVEEANG